MALFKHARKIFTGMAKHWYCEKCHHAFAHFRTKCPYCSSTLVEVNEPTGTKDAE